MATRRKRRIELARAAAVRKEARRLERARRRRRIRRLVALVLAVLILVAVVLWLLLRDGDSGSSASGPGNYADVVALSHHHAPTAEGAR